MIKKIGVKDEKGNNICLISNENKIPHNFYEKYNFKKISWKIGDNMAFMVVNLK